MKLALLATCTLIACANPVTDPREGNEDESLAYITETIFVPYCATAECHSTFKQADGYVFDTVEGAQSTIAKYNLITCANAASYDPCDVSADPSGKVSPMTELVQIISASGYNNLRMPYDQSMPRNDVYFITQWLIDGANGYVGTNPAPDDE
jgi:hypothetical protein